MLKHPKITVTGCVISVNLLKTGWKIVPLISCKTCESSIKPAQCVKFQGKWDRKWKFKKSEKMRILHGWSWCRLGWLPVKEQLRNGAVGLTLRYLGHAGSSVAYVSRPTHPLYTGYIPWSAIQHTNYIFLICKKSLIQDWFMKDVCFFLRLVSSRV